jgi:hypothetical protein
MEGFTIKLRGAPPSLVARDYLCSTCGPFDSLQPPELLVADCPRCGQASERIDSAPAVHTQFVVSVTRGKDDPKPHHLAMDTRSISEGQTHADWKKDRAKLWERERQRRVMEWDK